LSRIRSIASLRGGCVAKIANLVLGNPDEAVGMNILELADRVGTSASTVSRFCARLGYSSYKAFQIDLSASLASNPSSVSDYFSPGDDVATIARRVFALNSASLADSLALLDPGNLEQIARLVLSAKRVFIFGMGASGLIARLCAFRFESLGTTTISLSDPFEAVMLLASATEKDLLICISHSGRSSLVVNMASFAKEQGVCIVGITNYADSPLAKMAEFVLLTSFRERKVSAAVSSSAVAQVCVLDAVYFAAAHCQSEKTEKLGERIEKIADRLLRSDMVHRSDGTVPPSGTCGSTRDINRRHHPRRKKRGQTA
jgi:DNA-binding MurR/RpiR family transcriptional regulator